MYWGSTQIIGNVKDRFENIFRPERRWDEYRLFYNGWLEGRTAMLKKIKKSKADAYEFHNHNTGHCYVDYLERQGMGEKEGYVKTHLYSFK